MALLIGVPKETAPGEKRVATVPDVVEKLVKLGFSVAVESGAGDAANFADDTYRAAGAEVVPTAAELWAKADTRLQGARPQPGRSGSDARRRHADQLHLAGPEPGSDAAAGGQEGHRAGHRLLAAPAVARAEDGRADLHGRHQRLPRRDRGRQRLRPLLQRPDHRRRQDPAGQGLHRRRRCRRPGRDRHRRQPGRHRARQRHTRRGGRPGGVAGRRVRQGRLRGGRLRRRRLRQGDERGLPAGPARDVRQAGQGRGHHHHHRADPGQARTEADHRRDGAGA